ncbi:peptidoglycan-binding domain-containing protein [Maricaulis salignorans]|uniref:peptidoglycan-binding domain-containing protein n=1 Tax=Maricaulis salignorans TaxID=144026 RepID=UPI003A918BA8
MPPSPTPDSAEIDGEALCSADPAIRMDALDAALLADDANRIAPALPRSVEERDDFSMRTQRGHFVRALIDRLRRLGYLAAAKADALTLTVHKPNQNALQDPELILAITQLQREAGLMIDGWPGPQTWDALQGFYCFEGAKAELGRRRKRARQDDLAVLRACLLRLDALGLHHDPPGTSRMDAVEGLNIHALSGPAGTGALGDAEIRKRLTRAIAPASGKLRKVLMALGLNEAERSEAGLRALVLDHDHLVTRLAQLDTTVISEDNLTVAEPFIDRVLTIEMWLLGFRPVEKRLPNISLLPPQSDSISAHDVLAGAIKHFLNFQWDHRPRKGGAKDPVEAILGPYRRRAAERPGGPIARDIRRNFPVILRAIDLATNAAGADKKLNYKLVKKMSQEPDFLRALDVAIQTERSRLWDGIRRVIGWVFRFFRRVVAKFLEFAQKLVRVVFAFSAEAINAARDAIGIVRTGLTHVLAPLYIGPNRAMIACRDLDFDYQTITDSSRPAAAAQDGRFLELRARAMALATRLIARLFAVLRELAANALKGWIWVGIALLRISRHARQFARWVGEVRDLNEEFNRLAVRVF